MPKAFQQNKYWQIYHIRTWIQIPMQEYYWCGLTIGDYIQKSPNLLLANILSYTVYFEF